jgi:hypothetical protein
MVKERTKLISALVLTHLIPIPALLLISFLLNQNSLLSFSIIQTSILILFLAGYWEFLGLNFKIGFFVVLELLLSGSFIIKHTGISCGNDFVVIILTIAEGYLLFLLVKIILTIFPWSRNYVNISFPFKKGKYLITDGGNSKISRLMNYHYYSSVHKRKKTNKSMLFATDIVKIGMEGNRFFPSGNEDYPIFGEKVFSPVNGRVVKIENEIDDNIPYSGGYPYNTGNTIVIQSKNLYLLLGHLQKKSIEVKPGDYVMADQYLAKAGNSGFSERPHIHIQMIESENENYWSGIGIEMRVDKKNLFKNRIIDIG